MLNDKDYPALEVMADILGGGFQSRLFQKVRTQLGYAYEVSAALGRRLRSPRAFRDRRQHQIRQHHRNPQGHQCGSRAHSHRRKSPPKNWNRPKQTVVNGFIFNFDTPSKTLNRLLTYRYYGYPDDFIFQYQKAVQQVTRADILRVAKQYLDPAKFVIVAVGNPKDFGTPLTSLGLPVTDIDLTIPAAESAHRRRRPLPARRSPKAPQLLAKMAAGHGRRSRNSPLSKTSPKRPN